jgi:hypothetical protein
MSATIETLRRLDQRLARNGIPPLTPWWNETLERWYAHPTARTLVARVGRSGAKSHTSVKVALNETLFGDWKIPIGEIHRYVFVSVDKTEAAQRLHTLREFLTALGVPFNAAGDEIVLTEMPRAFKVCAAQIGAVSGYRAFGASLDEVAKWADGDAYSDPADEIGTSVGAMLVSHPGARRMVVSSPFGLDDFHARLFDAGNTETQLVCHAPTWIANPSISEARTHEVETDPARWSREYAAIPGDTESTAFASKDVLAAFARNATPGEGERFVLIDASQLRHDDFAFAIATGASDGGVVLLHVDGIHPGATITEAVDRIAEVAKAYGAQRIFGDRFEAGGLDALFLQRGLTLSTPAWSPKSKHAAGALLRRLLSEGALALPEHPRLRNELLNQRARLRPNDMVEYPTNGRDYVALLFVLCHAIESGLIDAEALRLLRNPYATLATDEGQQAMAVINEELRDHGGARRMDLLDIDEHVMTAHAAALIEYEARRDREDPICACGSRHSAHNRQSGAIAPFVARAMGVSECSGYTRRVA